MDADFLSRPEAFARANENARLEHLRSLTLESAAAELEAIFEVVAELERARAELGLPPLPPPPLPVSLAVLLGGSSPDEPPES